MQNIFNPNLFILGVGILQPVRPIEVITFLQSLYQDVSRWPEKEVVNALAERLEAQGYMLCLNKKVKLYSLTYMANLNMDKQVRYFRDKVRLSLLKEMYSARILMSDVAGQELDGDSPSTDTSSTTKDDSRPESSGLESSRAEATCLQTRAFWSRISEQQKIFKVGLDSRPSDSSPQFKRHSPFRYYSFPTLTSLQKASVDQQIERDMSATQLALCIGISPRLISSFMHKTENHYRRFTVPKKSGGEREIASPRLFLKVVQWWVKDYFLWGLKIHDACHAYLPGRSIQTNASCHAQRDYVANLDIEDFFGSISGAHVKNLLEENNIGPVLSKVLSRILTLEDYLPQGAPTSPVLSNAFLFEFDSDFSAYCADIKLNYTRYADDITISGDSKEVIISAIGELEGRLKKYDLKLKHSKTRIASKYSSQRVTGIVVNEKILPPREYRRKVRATFHKANLSPDDFIDRYSELCGHLSYLSSFVELEHDRSLKKYLRIIRKVRRSLSRRKRQQSQALESAKPAAL